MPQARAHAAASASNFFIMIALRTAAAEMHTPHSETRLHALHSRTHARQHAHTHRHTHLHRTHVPPMRSCWSCFTRGRRRHGDGLASPACLLLLRRRPAAFATARLVGASLVRFARTHITIISRCQRRHRRFVCTAPLLTRTHTHGAMQCDASMRMARCEFRVYDAAAVRHLGATSPYTHSQPPPTRYALHITELGVGGCAFVCVCRPNRVRDMHAQRVMLLVAVVCVRQR